MLYNGANCPDINTVWTDKETYPYAAIITNGNTVIDGVSYPFYNLCLMKTRPVGGDSYATFAAGRTCYLFRSHSSFNDTEWHDPWTDSKKGYYSTQLVWSSCDILKPDGSVYFGTSDPVDPNAKITSITISANSSVSKGGYLIVAAYVSGTGNFDKSCTASISGASSSTIAKLTNGQNWMLECGTDETASEITVTVTSAADPTITASKTITVVEAGTSGDGTGGGGDGTGGGGDGTGGSGDGTGGGTTGASAEDLQAAFMAGLATGLALYSRKG